MRPLRIGVTLGDPAGIGPEIVAATLAAGWPAQVTPVVFGHRVLLGEWQHRLEIVEPALPIGAVTPGTPNLDSAQAQVGYLDACGAALLDGKIDAVVTAPIHKQWAHRAGFRYPGHTELFAALAERPATMLFAGPRLRVALATVHCSLHDAIVKLTTSDVLEHTIARTALALRDQFGIARPRIAVAGLNPHAGEGGEFGDEETRAIAPAIERASHTDWCEVSGPHVPDAVFRGALIGEPDQRFDAVVALYHDQGLIPVKLVDFDSAVNVTIGLPFVRTSPDHGVAYDIAGRGLARPTSMRAAFELAIGLAATSPRIIR